LGEPSPTWVCTNVVPEFEKHKNRYMQNHFGIPLALGETIKDSDELVDYEMIPIDQREIVQEYTR
jgi:hypothetical protein